MSELITCHECKLPLVLLEMESDKVCQGPETHPLVAAWCESGLHDIDGMREALREADKKKKRRQ